MKPSFAYRRPGRGGFTLALIVVALLAIALLGAACSNSAPAAEDPAAAPTQPAAEATATAPAAPTVEAAAPADASAGNPSDVPAPSDLPTGVDSDGNFYRGDVNAAIKLIEYSDFQCPYCARHTVETGPQIDQNYVATGKVLHIFRNFPLDIHPNAMPAAKAAYCAGQQQPALFWGMHDWLFASQDTWSAAEDAATQFRVQAVALGADGAKYDTCLADDATAAAIQRDLNEGIDAGVQGTPAFFVNDWFLSGAQPYAQFQNAIDKAGQGLHPAPTATPLPSGVAPYDANPDKPGFTYDGNQTMGSADAPLLMIAFADFKCGYCAQYTKEVEPALREKYVDTGKMRIAFYFFPIYAPKSAVASLCAADQGKFWDFHDTLYAHQSEWQDGDNEAMVKYATSVGLDEASFRQCLADAPGSQVVDDDMQISQQIGLRGTPGFLFVDLKQHQVVDSIVGAAALDAFQTAIDNALNPPRRPPRRRRHPAPDPC